MLVDEIAPAISVPCCCCNKLSQTLWLKTTWRYSHTVLEVRILTSDSLANVKMLAGLVLSGSSERRI